MFSTKFHVISRKFELLLGLCGLHTAACFEIFCFIYIFFYSDFAVWWTPQSLTPQWDASRGVSWKFAYLGKFQTKFAFRGPDGFESSKRGWKSRDTLPLRLNSADSTGRTLCRDAASLGSKFDKTRGIVTKTLLKPAPLIRGPRSIGEEKIQQQSILQDCFFKVVLACRCTVQSLRVLFFNLHGEHWGISKQGKWALKLAAFWDDVFLFFKDLQPSKRCSLWKVGPTFWKL